MRNHSKCSKHSALGIHSRKSSSAPASPSGVCLYTPEGQGGAIVQSNTANLRMLGDSEANRGAEVAQDSQTQGEQHKAQARQSEEHHRKERPATRGNTKEAKYFLGKIWALRSEARARTLSCVTAAELKQSQILTKKTSLVQNARKEQQGGEEYRLQGTTRREVSLRKNRGFA